MQAHRCYSIDRLEGNASLLIDAEVAYIIESFHAQIWSLGTRMVRGDGRCVLYCISLSPVKSSLHVALLQDGIATAAARASQPHPSHAPQKASHEQQLVPSSLLLFLAAANKTTAASHHFLLFLHPSIRPSINTTRTHSKAPYISSETINPTFYIFNSSSSSLLPHIQDVRQVTCRPSSLCVLGGRPNKLLQH